MKITIFDKNLWKSYLSVLGTIGIFTSFLTIFISIKDEYKLWIGLIFLVLIVLVFIALLYRANHTEDISLTINGLKVTISYGDLFCSNGLKLIPFNEYFDTQVDNIILAENTLNGKFVKRYYPIVSDFDTQIETALSNIPFERNDNRLMGKKNKYVLGTTIEVANEYILTAFTHFDDSNRAYLTKGEYLLCLDNLWKEINRIYAQRDINIPLLGSGISRIGNDLKLQDYLEQILNSIKLSNIDNAYNTKVNIVLHESVKEHINLFEIKNRY
jgi:Ca2+/Na+ antiporter